MRKRGLAVLMAAVLGTTLAACGNTPDSKTTKAPENTVKTTEERTTEDGNDKTSEAGGQEGELSLRFSWWGGDARHEATLKAIEVYEKANPGIKIEPEYSSFSGYYEKLVTQLASGNAPDIFQVDQGWVAELYARGDAFADFSDYKDSIDLAQIPESMMTDYCTIDGQVMVLPFGYNGTVFLYNKTLLADWCDAEGNLEVKTWDDFLEIGKALHEKDPESYMTTAVTDGYLRYILKPMLEQITGKIDVQDDFTLGFGPEELAKAYDSFMKIFTEQVSQPYEEAVLYDSMQNNPLWLNGKIGGIFLFFSNIDTEIAGLDYDYGVTAMPMFQDAKVSGQECCPSLMVAINKNIDGAHKKAAAEFLDWFINSEEASLILGTVRGVPGSASALEALEKNGMLSDLMSQGIKISNDTLSLKNGAYELNASVKAVFVEYMEKVIYGVSSPEDAAQGMTEDLESVLAELGKK
ncbi:ABC transporter substrate-binding protein [Cuneatibacter caecimuris]|uniref:Oligogalacturonide transport system substrate-binding protein n=1 Tax=Cuneatibacter caecimuris TaxID=1796618 RepID=A0A4Q7PRR7_9FIRM|nr:extracellular solute-binding protein [Cuneatibacter caecimuris]RZT02788.1 oligogalacturonide transport system substrate-binding protein [Cuneatibacter caecimuris]